MQHITEVFKDGVTVADVLANLKLREKEFQQGMTFRQRGEKIRVLEHPWVAISETPLSVRHQYEMLLHGE